MPEKSYLPFGSEAGVHGGRKLSRSRGLESKAAHYADKTMLRQRLRHDRLIVGGRAHTRKRGLS
ncbi:MAG: hypothetical protein IBX63_06965 [Coriobacteriia bacterium]|nr:hypothetical protein [Coriobacteriia bacterium]